MTNEVRIQQAAVQTRLPDHELAARQQRASVVGLPRPQQPPKPFVRPEGARKTWHVAWPAPNGESRGQSRLLAHPLCEPF